MVVGGGVFGSWELISLEDEQAARQDERRQDALSWIVAYVDLNPGTPKTAAVEAFADHHGRGGRGLANKVIDTALAASETGSTFQLAKGPGKAANGIYLYPAPQASFPLPKPQNGKLGNHSEQLPPERVLPASRPP